MSRRERLERRREKREEWAEKADARGDARFQRADDLVKNIPLGQPILVGHHSEKAHRNTIKRSHQNMFKGCEEKALASKHRSKAGGIQSQLDRSIFSDDDNAIEAIEARIAEHQASRERMKQINAAYKKADGADWFERVDTMLLDPPLGNKEREAVLRNLRFSPGGPSRPFPSYCLSNLGGRIAADKKRIVSIKARRAKAARAEAAGGLDIQEHESGYCTVTFAEKPARAVLDALKAADFYWSSGSWFGMTKRLPEAVRELG